MHKYKCINTAMVLLISISNIYAQWKIVNHSLHEYEECKDAHTYVNLCPNFRSTRNHSCMKQADDFIDISIIIIINCSGSILLLRSSLAPDNQTLQGVSRLLFSQKQCAFSRMYYDILILFFRNRQILPHQVVLMELFKSYV